MLEPGGIRARCVVRVQTWVLPMWTPLALVRVKLLLVIVLAFIAREKFATTSEPGATVLTPLAPSAEIGRASCEGKGVELGDQGMPMASRTLSAALMGVASDTVAEM